MRPHNHAPNKLHLAVCALKKSIFQRVRAGDQSSLQDIAEQESQSFPMMVRSQISLASMESQFNAIKGSLRPAVPRSLGVLGALLLLPQYHHLTKTLHVPETMFAGMCGTMADKTLSLVFISPEMRSFMESRSTVFSDGTERKLFRKPKASQIFTVSAVWRHHVLPMMRAIMLSRSQAAYVTLFSFLKNLMPNFKPKSVKCDFEDAQCNAWEIVFSPLTIEGCLWHFDVAIFRMARNKLGLYQVVKDEEEVASIIRSAGALPLLSTEDIEGGLIDLGEEAKEKGWMPLLKPFFKYMAKEWLPKVHILSVKDSVHRTNNASESSNRSFNRKLRAAKPSCYQVLGAILSLNDRATADKALLGQLKSPSRGRRVSALRNDARIQKLTSDYSSGEISRLKFLHVASRTLQNVFNTQFQ